jgi:hypothetical protein
MRAYELYETDAAALGIYNPAEDKSARQITDTRKPEITLKLLNRLKHIKNRRKRELKKKEAFLPVIYGDKEIAEDDYYSQKRELEQIKDEIGLEIDTAELNQEKKEHISSMAMNVVNGSSK